MAATGKIHIPSTWELPRIVYLLKELVLFPFFTSGWTMQTYELSSGSNTIAHRLGRAPLGMVLVESTAKVEYPGLTNKTQTHVTLDMSAAATIKVLWF